MSEKPLLEMIGIDKTFGHQIILKDCSLIVQRRETVVLVDPSSSEKFALLCCVNMLSPVDSGDVFLVSQRISRGDVPTYKPRQRIGMAFQSCELFSHLTAMENIALALMVVLGTNRTDAHRLVDNLLVKVRISEYADHFPDGLSGRQQQRVAIARALVMKPELMLYDEPTSALDPEIIRGVLEVMVGLSTEGMTSMVVTHEIGFTRRVANKTLFVKDGEVIGRANTSDFFTGHISDHTQRFLT